MKISVITVNRNNKEGLRKTIESVIAQTLQPFEFIIIDGASTDGSVDLLDMFSKSISYKVSESDSGIYNAMNKGIAVANGDYCVFMNSGDCFCGPEVIRDLEENGSEADIICGNAVILEKPVRKKTPPSEITMRYLYDKALCHQSALIRTDLLKTHLYDESLRIVADRKFFLEVLILEGRSYDAVDIDIANYDITGFSARNRFASQEEWKMVLKQTIPEKILIDYGREVEGQLYGFSAYERLFLEIGHRRYRKPVYRLARKLLVFSSIFIKSASFVKAFPKTID